jgi:hypothetical protein
MAQYRHRPTIIDAVVYERGMEDGFEYEDQLGEEVAITQALYAGSIVDGVRIYPYINTLEGKHYIGAGDYIITGINGERYPCKPDIFEKSYELIKE